MLNALGWGKKYNPHASRTTSSKRLNELRFSSDWIERQLAHAELNAVRCTYSHAVDFSDRAKMMQQWTDMFDTWKKGDDNVTPIKRLKRAFFKASIAVAHKSGLIVGAPR